MNKLDNTDEESIYIFSKRFVLFSLVISLFAVSTGFLTNFSLRKEVINLITQGVKQNRQCPANFERLDISYLLPKIKISDLNISRKCLDSTNSLLIQSLIISPGFPSLNPLGIGLNTLIKDKFSTFKILSIHGLNSHQIRINSKKFDAKSISPLLPTGSIEGNFKLDAIVDIEKRYPKSLDLRIESKNFTIPSQNIGGLNLPQMKIGNLLLVAKMKDGKKLNIKEIIIGSGSAPIRASIKGFINVNKLNILRSRLKLTATFKFTTKFLEDFPIVNLLLNPKKQDAQGFYKVKIGGTIARPSKPQFI